MTKIRKRRTLKDVAEAANVSEMTVSRVLRKSGTVSAGTRKTVLAAIDRLGYVENRMAGSLATARSNQVAVIIPSLSNHVFTEVLSGISEMLDREGYQAVVGVSDYSIAKEEELVYSMMSWRPAGFVVSNVRHSPKTRNVLLNADIPVVEIMNLPEDPIEMCVGLNHTEAGRALAAYMVTKKYRRFGYVGWNESDYAAAIRFQAIKAELERHGFGIFAPDLFNRPPNLASGKSGLIRLLEQAPDRDAVFFSNDTAATGGLMHCLQAGISVPDRLAIAGFSGLESGQNLPKRLTTILTNRYETGRRAARNILQQLSNTPVRLRWDMGFELIEGETG